MARMYSRKRGKSGSTKPAKKEVSTWLRYKPKEVEVLVQKLGKDTKSSAKIGVILRDTYGIPSVKIVCGKGIAAMLKEKNLSEELPEDLLNLIRRSVIIQKHLEENHKDQPARRGLLLTTSKIGRLAKYYKKTGVLPADWKLDAKSLRLYAE